MSSSSCILCFLRMTSSKYIGSIIAGTRQAGFVFSRQTSECYVRSVIRAWQVRACMWRKLKELSLGLVHKPRLHMKYLVEKKKTKIMICVSSTDISHATGGMSSSACILCFLRMSSSKYLGSIIAGTRQAGFVFSRHTSECYVRSVIRAWQVRACMRRKSL